MQLLINAFCRILFYYNEALYRVLQHWGIKKPGNYRVNKVNDKVYLYSFLYSGKVSISF
jgi:hypothetical protein